MGSCFSVSQFLQRAAANSHTSKRPNPIVLDEAIVSTSVLGPPLRLTFGMCEGPEDRGSIFTGLEPTEGKRGQEMSCQRCGGVLDTELAAAMYELVCGKVVIENRYCHCDEVESPVRTDSSREGREALARGVPQTTTAERERQ